ncbi:hypothetical protein CDAR_105801 [Caerostris darwini]|uniref:Uncharacterized protein n=1 Tax=Caerostris darwini TaxID=1538125 RepID=A0AAV4TP39_9ARAC|nr:hypothetical protein CDAR_105801 [Caerostris darwini]
MHTEPATVHRLESASALFKTRITALLKTRAAKEKSSSASKNSKKRVAAWHPEKAAAKPKKRALVSLPSQVNFSDIMAVRGKE